MYLARVYDGGRLHYVIRQSYPADGRLRSRDLFDLGPDPAAFIVYVGGRGYYYAEPLLSALAEADAAADPDALDRLLFEFLDPEIQRVIAGFDRRRRRTAHRSLAMDGDAMPPPHLFDRRRYHYLRFGHSEQRHIGRVPESVFHPLYAKSRDELEQYFWAEERRLRLHEKAAYVNTIFELRRFVPDPASDRTLLEQMDRYFVSRLCRLDADERFWTDLPHPGRLRDYLVRYAILYFDLDPPRQSPWQAYVEDFINRHRTYHPPAKVRIKLEEAGHLFGLPWKTLKKLDQRSLTRLYHRLALKHHPDQGGDPELFRRLTDYYKVLLKRGKRG
ncbi:hypothetical protein [Desulfatitalea alkaliphila]|uniref:J domain-containing protein n=1 Tax=Desulfatitalea alkaliphila TaxID=2929485 RepID=A0AA41R1K7_9BACT|nr:hypothetical protein [Desulfatitalea alkaliphila]MCJ8500088.1 hypothetical protein [Desulfatitalea alkaliphila]